MTDRKIPEIAQHFSDGTLKENGAEANKKDGSLEKSEPKGVSVERGRQPHPDVTRFGDWEKNGRCMDF